MLALESGLGRQHKGMFYLLWVNIKHVFRVLIFVCYRRGWHLIACSFVCVDVFKTFRGNTGLEQGVHDDFSSSRKHVVCFCCDSIAFHVQTL